MIGLLFIFTEIYWAGLLLVFSRLTAFHCAVLTAYTLVTTLLTAAITSLPAMRALSARRWMVRPSLWLQFSLLWVGMFPLLKMLGLPGLVQAQAGLTPGVIRYPMGLPVDNILLSPYVLVGLYLWLAAASPIPSIRRRRRVRKAA